MSQYVFSRTMKASPDPAVKLVSEKAADIVRELKAQTGKDIWLCGGADLASTLFTAGLLDDIIVKQNPVVFGSGKSLLSAFAGNVALELSDKKIFDNGVVVLRYRVKRAAR